jgi:GTP cyclohydrolase I
MHNGNGNADLRMAASLAVTSPTNIPSIHAVLSAQEQDVPVDRLQPIIRMLLLELGVDVSGQHLRDTPARVARFFREYTRGYDLDPAKILKTFHSRNRDHIVVSDIEFFSLCPHHLLVYGGKMHFGYIPDGRIVGISKIPRLVQVWLRAWLCRRIWSPILPTRLCRWSSRSGAWSRLPANMIAWQLGGCVAPKPR